MAGALADGTSASTGFWLKALKSWPLSNNSFLNNKVVGVELVVILSVGYRAFERLENKTGRFFRSKTQEIDCVCGWQPLNGTSDLASLEGGDFGEPVNRFYLQFCFVFSYFWASTLMVSLFSIRVVSDVRD